MVVDLLKTAFVDAAISDFGRKGKPASKSRASQVTGLSRREVRRLLEHRDAPVYYEDIYGSSEAEVLSMWHARPDLLDAAGQPTDLDFGPGAGTFTQLVHDSIGSDNTADVFNRLAQAGCVELTENGQVRMTRRDFVTSRNLPTLMLDTIGTLASTIDKNWRHPDDPPLTHRIAFSTKIDPKKLDIVRRSIKQRIIRFAEELDDYLMELEPDDAGSSAARQETHVVRLGIGAYYFEIDQSD